MKPVPPPPQQHPYVPATPPQLPNVAAVLPPQPAPFYAAPTAPPPIPQSPDRYGSDPKQASTRIDLNDNGQQQTASADREKRLNERERVLTNQTALQSKFLNILYIVFFVYIMSQ